MDRPLLSFAPLLTAGTKIQVCGSNVNTRKLLDNSTNCHMLQERSNILALINPELLSTQTIGYILQSSSRVRFTATESEM